MSGRGTRKRRELGRRHEPCVCLVVIMTVGKQFLVVGKIFLQTIRSARSAKPTDAYYTLSHGPAARSAKPTRARPRSATVAPSRRAGRYGPPIALRSARTTPPLPVRPVEPTNRTERTTEDREGIMNPPRAARQQLFKHAMFARVPPAADPQPTPPQSRQTRALEHSQGAHD